jgi:hypothetical protein
MPCIGARGIVVQSIADVIPSDTELADGTAAT